MCAIAALTHRQSGRPDASDSLTDGLASMKPMRGCTLDACREVRRDP